MVAARKGAIDQGVFLASLCRQAASRLLKTILLQYLATIEYTRDQPIYNIMESMMPSLIDTINGASHKVIEGANKLAPEEGAARGAFANHITANAVFKDPSDRNSLRQSKFVPRPA